MTQNEKKFSSIRPFLPDQLGLMVDLGCEKGEWLEIWGKAGGELYLGVDKQPYAEFLDRRIKFPQMAVVYTLGFIPNDFSINQIVEMASALSLGAPPDLIKIDLEGTEYNLMKDGSLIRAFSCSYCKRINLETHGGPSDHSFGEEWMRSNGFTSVGMGGWIRTSGWDE